MQTGGGGKKKKKEDSEGWERVERSHTTLTNRHQILRANSIVFADFSELIHGSLDRENVLNNFLGIAVEDLKLALELFFG